MTVNRTAHLARCARVWVGAIVAIMGWSVASSAQPLASRDPIRVGPYLHDLGATHVEVRAAVDPPGPFEVTLRKAGADGSAPRVFSSKPAAMHVVPIDGLEPRTRYEYVATSGKARVEGALVTAPPDDDRTPFVALAYGDNRTDDHAHELVVRAMLDAPSDLLLHTGDFVDDSSRELQWKQFFDIEAPLLRDRCLFTTIGNHEWLDDGRSYRGWFGPNNATARWQFVRFYFVDAQDASAKSWLVPELEKHHGEPGVAWRVVVLHQGPWSSGPHGPNPQVTTSTIDAWRAHGVDLVLSGHDHIYERGFANGIRYVVTGGGGAPPYTIEDRMRGTRKAEATRHFVRLELATDRVKLAARRADGSIIEEVSFDVSGGWSDDRKVEAPIGAGAEPEPKWAEKPREETSWGGWVAALAAVGATGALLVALRRRYRR